MPVGKATCQWRLHLRPQVVVKQAASDRRRILHALRLQARATGGGKARWACNAAKALRVQVLLVVDGARVAPKRCSQTIPGAARGADVRVAGAAGEAVPHKARNDGVRAGLGVGVTNKDRRRNQEGAER